MEKVQVASRALVRADTTGIFGFLDANLIPEDIAAELVFRTDTHLDALIIAPRTRVILATIACTTSTLVSISRALESPGYIAAIEVLSTDTRRNYGIITARSIIRNTATAGTISTIRSARNARFRRVTNVISTTFSWTIRRTGT